MSRYATDGNAASAANAYDQLEAPLPTYEEVVGTETPHHLRLGFKSDVLLTAGSPDQGQSSVDCAGGGAPNRGDSEGLRRTATCKPNKIGTILILLGMIVIPMCGTIIILEIKTCVTEQAQLQQSIDKINASYSDCNDELASLQENLNSNEATIRDLRWKLEEVTNQRDKLKLIVLDKSSKAKSSILNSVED